MVDLSRELRIARLVKKDLDEAVEAEREACAKLAEEWNADIADAIRKRNQL